MLSAVKGVRIQSQGRQGHGDVDEQQARELELLFNRCVICKVIHRIKKVSENVIFVYGYWYF